MPTLTHHADGLLFRSFIDEDAPPILNVLVPPLRSKFLTNTIMEQHTIGARTVCMRDETNFVMTAELPRAKLVGFIVAEVNPDNDRAILHVVYTLRGMRRNGYGKILLGQFEAFLTQVGCTNITLVPATRISLAIFQKRATLSSLRYDIRTPDEATLDYGDREIVND